MQKNRVDALADGIFAIVMTLLVIEIRVPELHGHVTNEALLVELKELLPLFMSYILAFLMLATYWIAHNFIITLYAKNITRTAALMTMPFLMAVALTPFSSHFLGEYHYLPIGVIVFSANLIVIGLLLYLLRYYVHNHSSIENDREFITAHDMYIGTIRILLPVLGAVIASVISFYDTYVAIALLMVVIIFNVVPTTLNWLLRVTGWHKDHT